SSDRLGEDKTFDRNRGSESTASVVAPAKRREPQPAPRGGPPPSDPGSEAPAPSARKAGLAPDKMQGILDAAQMLAGKGKKPEAFAKYKEVLESDPAQPEALAWSEDYLRSKRDYGQLRDVLLASIRASANTPEMLETRKERLREVAGL